MKTSGPATIRRLGQFLSIMVMFLLTFIGPPDGNGVSCEHGDLGSISFHLRRKTKSHRHAHRHFRAQNKTHFSIGIGRSKDGFSLRVREYWQLLSCSLYLC